MRTAVLAWTTLSINAVVVLQGAVVRVTGSGAGCGQDWPRCQGEFVPLTHGTATWIEYSHRLLSGLALIAGAWLLVHAIRRRRDRPGFLPFAAASAFLLAVEALIGAGTVLTGLTGDNVSVARGLLVAFHLLNSLLLIGALALTVAYATRDCPWPPRWTGQTPILALATVGFLGFLLLNFAGGIAAMGNTMFPSESLAEGIVEDFSADSHPLIRLRLLHPILGVAVGLFLLLSHALTGWLKPIPPLGGLRKALLGIYLAQGLVGLVNLAMLGPILLQLLHLGMATAAFALWMLATWLTLSWPKEMGPASSNPVEPEGVAG